MGARLRQEEADSSSGSRANFILQLKSLVFCHFTTCLRMGKGVAMDIVASIAGITTSAVKPKTKLY